MAYTNAWSFTLRNDRMDTLASAVPPKERLRLPDDNEPAPLGHQEGHIQINAGEIDSDLREILQKPYISGLAKDDNWRIPYFPGGFTVGTVLSGDLSEVYAAEEVPVLGGYSRPEKMALHVEFCDPAYGGMVRMRQRRTPSTREKLAIFAGEGIQNIIAGLPAFPYSLDQIKVLSIDVRSRGTVQPRIFVTSDATAA